MAYNTFTFPAVQQTFGLALHEEPLFSDVAEQPVSPEFREQIREGADLSGLINTEKARSEFVVAPLLLEVRRRFGGAVFSGVAFDVDPDRGLNGYCDFLLCRSPLQSVVTAPVVAVAEGKNDNTRNGLGQCVAGMVAAQEFNARAGTAVGPVYGASTTGTAWRFLRLRGAELTLDAHEYSIAELGRILGVFAHIFHA